MTRSTIGIGVALALAGVAVVLAVALRSARDAEPPIRPISSAGRAADLAEEIRIVSLSPAITRAVVDMGLAERIIARSAFCTAVDESVPVAGDLHDLDTERLVRLKPTHVLVQPPGSGVSEALQRLAAERGWSVGAWQLNTVDDIEAMVRALPAVLCADAPGDVQQDRDDDEDDEGERAALRADAACLEKLTARAAALLNDIAAALTPAGADVWRGRVLLVNATQPIMVFGERTYLDDVLRAMGSTNAAHGEGWMTLTHEDVTRLDPEAIVLVMPGGDAGAEAAALDELRDLAVTAVREDRIGVLRHRDALLPSSAIVDVAAELRAILRSFNAEDAP